jgi:hypothetical protein
MYDKYKYDKLTTEDISKKPNDATLSTLVYMTLNSTYDYNSINTPPLHDVISRKCGIL